MAFSLIIMADLNPREDCSDWNYNTLKTFSYPLNYFMWEIGILMSFIVILCDSPNKSSA